MADTKIQTFEDFEKIHGLLLISSDLPKSLHRQLYQKLSSDTFDGGDFFQIEPCSDQDGRQRRLVLTSDGIEKDSHVFLVDHAWTFRLSDALKQLQEVPGLAERMASLMCVDDHNDYDSEETELLDDSAHVNNTKTSVFERVENEIRQSKEKGDDTLRWLELEDLNIDDDMLLSLDLPSRFPDLHALSLCGNNLKNAEIVIPEMTKFKNLRALWLDNNPFIQNSDVCMVDTILQGCARLEIYNSHFTNNYGEWAFGFCGGAYGKEDSQTILHNGSSLQSLTSLDLSNRCIPNLRQKAFSPAVMPSLSCLNIRGNSLKENSECDLLQMLKEFDQLHGLEVDIPGPLGESALKILESLPNLSLINGVSASMILEQGKHVIDAKLEPRLAEWAPDEPLADRVISAMWLYSMTYRLADEEKIDETSVWYVMDELGSALRHSDFPNFRVSPFLYMPEGKLGSAVSYSILWPIQNVKTGDECTRDYLPAIGEDKQRSSRLTAWFHTPQNYFIHEFEKYCKKLSSRSTDLSLIKSYPERKLLCGTRTLRVYTDHPQVEEFLTHPQFSITNVVSDADIIWASMQVDEEIKKANGITDQQYINQFPFEACLVMKHYLADTIQKAHGSPPWLQPTYNLETHLSQLIGDYLVRKRDGLDNLWILKPWNMARTIDTTVTGDLSAIIRLMETGPKICQKYIEHPALFNGKKFDLRYIVLVRSMDPLEIFLADVFWVRLANNSYTLDKRSLSEYETHFTVMNYGRRLNHMNTPEFVKEFEQEHNVKWLDIHQRVKTMLRLVFESAALVHPEMQCPTSRAMYGVDVMLDSAFQPKLLEVTYCPDCARACKYDTEAIFKEGEIVRGQDFYNFVFGCLFLNETKHVTPL